VGLPPPDFHQKQERVNHPLNLQIALKRQATMTSMNEPSLSGCASVTATLRLRNRNIGFSVYPGFVPRIVSNSLIVTNDREGYYCSLTF
jgi:hypothetical protein